MTLVEKVVHRGPTGSGPIQTPRLRLKPLAPETGIVDGAWWPRSDDLAGELPDLLAVLTVRLGGIERVQYGLNEWKDVPKTVDVAGRTVKLDGYWRQPPGTIGVLGLTHDALTLLVVPVLMDAEDAHTSMMTAAHPDDRGTPDALLGVGTDERIARDLSTIAVQRWESEGERRPSRRSTRATTWRLPSNRTRKEFVA